MSVGGCTHVHNSFNICDRVLLTDLRQLTAEYASPYTIVLLIPCSSANNLDGIVKRAGC